MDMPPSRYKVVEKGRRLIVVDRLTGEQIKHQIHAQPHRSEQRYGLESMERPAPPPAPRKEGPGRMGGVFTTQDWYDDKAPRALMLNDQAFNTLLFAGVVLFAIGFAAFVFIGWFALFAVGLLFQKGAWAALKRGVTAWLDDLPEA